MVIEVIEQLLSENAFISSLNMIKSEIELRKGIVVQEHLIRKQMKVLDLKYKRVKHISTKGNS